MILSGPNAWLGSIKDARILPAFLHSPLMCVSIACASELSLMHTLHAARQRIIDRERHPESSTLASSICSDDFAECDVLPLTQALDN